jgi:uncharacterized membrane protein
MYIPFTGYALLGILAVLIMAGVLQRIFDKMRMSSWVALLLVIGVLGLSFVQIWFSDRFALNLGGWIIPFGITVYLLIRTGFNRQLLNAAISTTVTAGAVFLMRYFIPMDTLGMEILAAIVIGLIAGAVSYLLGRSRRGAFISAVLGITAGELIAFGVNSARGLTPTLLLGANGMFDSIIIATIAAVLLAELVGSMRTDDLVSHPAPRYAGDTEAGEDNDK